MSARTRRRQRLDDDAGAVVIWMLGLSLMLLGLGGLTLGVWEVFGDRRELADIADTMAIAAASGIDETLLRDTGQVVIDEDRARDLARSVLARQEGGAALIETAIVEFTLDGIRIELTRDVPLGLIGILSPGGDDVTVTVEAFARPRLLDVP